MQKSAMASMPLLASMMLSLAAADYAAITGYVPDSDVTSHSMIDLDLAEMEMHMRTGTEAAPKARDFEKAKAIYQNGAHSGATATLTVGALVSDAVKGTVVTQGDATGVVKKTATATATTIVVSYTSICKEGGTDTQNVSGCFTVQGGDIDATGTIATASSVVNSYRTLAGFSTAAEGKMDGHEYYAVFKAYWGNGAYADQKVIDALDKTGSCATCDDIARDQIAKKASAFMGVWMYVIREMEDAIMDCSNDCIDCNDDPVHAWDEAVAFYSGSLEGTTQSSAGKLFFRQAEKRCGAFGTCAVQGEYGVDKMSFVNQELIKEFTKGRDKLLAGKCVDTIPIKRRIVNLMSVPLVQGSLRYGYRVGITEEGDNRLAFRAQADVFSHSILPRVAVCDPAAAEIIRANLKWDAATPMGVGYAGLKAAFEGVYDCMGITCEMVGGYLTEDNNPAKGYIKGMEPCGAAPAPEGNSILMTVLPPVIAAAIAGAVVYFMMSSSQPTGGDQELVANAA